MEELLQLDLQRIEKEKYQLREGEQHQDFFPLLLQYIGDTQPLRDDLIADVFVELVKWRRAVPQCCIWPRSRSHVIARVNSKNFVRSLYFRRGQDSRGNELNDENIVPFEEASAIPAPYIQPSISLGLPKMLPPAHSSF